MDRGDQATIVLPAWALNATFTAHGDASIRRTRAGWLLIRTGAGAARLDAHVADRQLRTAP
jgi:hypothetical protein